MQGPIHLVSWDQTLSEGGVYVQTLLHHSVDIIIKKNASTKTRWRKHLLLTELLNIKITQKVSNIAESTCIVTYKLLRVSTLHRMLRLLYKNLCYLIVSSNILMSNEVYGDISNHYLAVTVWKSGPSFQYPISTCRDCTNRLVNKPAKLIALQVFDIWCWQHSFRWIHPAEGVRSHPLKITSENAVFNFSCDH